MSSLPVGAVVAVQGLKGELRINPASEVVGQFTEPGTRWLQARGKAPKDIELTRKTLRDLLRIQAARRSWAPVTPCEKPSGMA